MLDSHLCSGRSLCISPPLPLSQAPTGIQLGCCLWVLVIPLLAFFLGIREPGCRFLLCNLFLPPRTVTVNFLCHVDSDFPAMLSLGLGPEPSLGPLWCCRICLSVHEVKNFPNKHYSSVIYPLEHISPSSVNHPFSVAPPLPPRILLTYNMASFVALPSAPLYLLSHWVLLLGNEHIVGYLVQKQPPQVDCGPNCFFLYPCLGKSSLVVSFVTLLTSCLDFGPKIPLGLLSLRSNGPFMVTANDSDVFQGHFTELHSHVYFLFSKTAPLDIMKSYSWLS